MSQKKRKTLKYAPENRLPKLGKIATTWDLRRLFYASERDPRIEKDLRATERAYAAFAKKYAGKDFVSAPRKLLAALRDADALMETRGAKAGYYLGYRLSLNAKDAAAEKMQNLIDDRITKAQNLLIFFDIAIKGFPAAKRRAYLADPLLADYRYLLSRLFDEAEHLLTEAEERILSLKSNVSSGMWVQGTSKILANRKILWEGKEIAIPEALERIDLASPAKKRALWKLILDQMENISEIAENEFNAIATNKKINDELRRYPKPYSATIQNYENDEKSVLALIEAVSTKGFALSRRFYALKAAYHGVPKLPYVNKYDPVGTPPSVPFAQAVEICRDSFYGVNPAYGKIFDAMLMNGQIDVYPKAGKRGGAFMSDGYKLPTLVFLNHVDTAGSMGTLAHEMGHAIHAERSKLQPGRYQDFSTVTAETASTLFEQIVDAAVLRQAPGRDRMVLLHDRIGRDIATIQRQVAFFNFELELHDTVRSEGAVTKEELREMMVRHLRSYLGPAVEVTKRDGWGYVYVPHFRYGFYVYSYAYGLLASGVMARRLREDRGYAGKIDAFLTAGGSDTVENIFASIGIDTRKTETFFEGLASLEQDIDEFERLIAKR
jgi:oligoendopeptidase F